MEIQNSKYLFIAGFAVKYGMIIISIIIVLTGCSGLHLSGSTQNVIDCSVYKTNTAGGSLKFDLGAIQLPGAIELGLARKEAIKWDGTMQRLVARYLELCSRHNAGMLTKKEYNKRIERIDLLSHEARALEQRIIHDVWQHHDEDIARLKNEPETESEPEKEEMRDSINRDIHRLSEKISTTQ